MSMVSKQSQYYANCYSGDICRLSIDASAYRLMRPSGPIWSTAMAIDRSLHVIERFESAINPNTCFFGTNLVCAKTMRRLWHH